MITGALVGSTLFSVLLWVSNLGKDSRQTTTRIVAVCIFFVSVGGLIGGYING